MHAYGFVGPLQQIKIVYRLKQILKEDTLLEKLDFLELQCSPKCCVEDGNKYNLEQGSGYKSKDSR